MSLMNTSKVNWKSELEKYENDYGQSTIDRHQQSSLTDFTG